MKKEVNKNTQSYKRNDPLFYLKYKVKAVFIGQQSDDKILISYFSHRTEKRVSKLVNMNQVIPWKDKVIRQSVSIKVGTSEGLDKKELKISEDILPCSQIYNKEKLKQQTLNIKIKPLFSDATIPQYQSEGAAGFDLHAYLGRGVESVILQPGERRLIPTALAFAIPFGLEMQLRPRSGLAFKHGVTVLNSPATIDSDYRGEVKVLLINHGSEPFIIKDDDRIAQGVIAPVKQGNFIVVDTLDETERGSGGFGHTGK